MHPLGSAFHLMAVFIGQIQYGPFSPSWKDPHNKSQFVLDMCTYDLMSTAKSK